MYYISDVPPHHNKLSGPGPRTKHGHGACVGRGARVGCGALQVYSKKFWKVGSHAIIVYVNGI